MGYNIGLDIGTASVGWCVTDDKNNILKHGKKALIGSRIFDEGVSREKRRLSRTTRRRYDRRKTRITLLYELLKPEIEKVDPHFIIKLKESFYQIDDDIKTNKEGLDFVLKDLNYYKDYKTIYHLRASLIEKKEKKDIRLVYMAIAHILKYRGNFLYEGTEFNLDSTPEEVKQNIENVMEYFNEQYDNIYQRDAEELINCLKKDLKSRVLHEELIKLFNVTTESKTITRIKNICNAFVGYSFNVVKIFDIDEELKIEFSKPMEDYEEKLDELLDEEQREIIEMMKDIYDFAILQKIMSGEKHISKVYMKKYDEYAKDLRQLKDVYRDLLSEEKYNEMFRSKSEIANYYNYNGKNFKKHQAKRNGAKSELRDITNLYKTIKNDISPYENNEAVQKIIQKIDDKTFLSRLKVTENGSIPYQIHLLELKKILESQSQFYSIFNEKDENGITIKEKIISIMSFRIPYYIGPLNSKSDFAWIIKNNNDKIYPWNFNDNVDTEKSAEKFITRMTSKCTYLNKEDVLPRQSLLYSKYCVLNELANITINGKKIDEKLKKLIVEELFINKQNKKISEKRLIEFLKENNFPFEIVTIDGFTQKSGEKSFLNNLGSYIDMIRIFESRDFVDNNEDKIEEIIKAITIFTEKAILKKRIKKILPQIEEDKLIKLLKLKYTGWGALSKKLLTGIRSIDDNKTIIEKLENSNLRHERNGFLKQMNFMQIINEPVFGFKEQIEKIQKEGLTNTFSYKDINEIACAPSVKRSLWQTVQVVKEIVKIQKKEPDNIFIEFTRRHDLKKRGKNTDSRIVTLKKIYETLGEEGKEVFKELKKEEKSLSDMRYLYYLQNGKCLYSGATLNLSNLSEMCEIDHIIPRSYIKDDSFDNKALVLRKYNQEKKEDKTVLDVVPIESKCQITRFWLYLKAKSLMTDKKYRNLNRKSSFNEEEKEKFIARQLVETSQTIKHVANIFKNIYKDTKVFAIRAKMTSDFRNKYDVIKCRSVNDYHHAHDAFIISIIGNHAIRYGLTNLEYGLKNEYEMKRSLREYYKINDDICANKNNKDLSGIVLNVLELDSNFKIGEIKSAINKEKVLVTKKLEEQTGEFYNQTLYGKEGSNESYINAKKNLDTSRYGGYKSSNKAYFSIISYKDKKNTNQIGIVGITIQEQKLIESKQTTLLQCIEQKGYKDIKILKEKIMKYQKFTNGHGNLLELTSDKYYSSAKQLMFNTNILKTIKIIEKKEYIKYDKEAAEEFNTKLDELYKVFIKKINTEVKEYITEAKKLKSAEEQFNNLTQQEKIQVLERILEVMKGTYKDLSKIKLSKVFGCRNYFKMDDNLIFIDQSITGVYEKRYRIKDLI